MHDIHVCALPSHCITVQLSLFVGTKVCDDLTVLLLRKNMKGNSRTAKDFQILVRYLSEL